jgi:hypothetical protein
LFIRLIREILTESFHFTTEAFNSLIHGFSHLPQHQFPELVLRCLQVAVLSALSPQVRGIVWLRE